MIHIFIFLTNFFNRLFVEALKLYIQAQEESHDFLSEDF